MSASLPSVPLEALGESCFTQAPVAQPSTSQQAAPSPLDARAAPIAAPQQRESVVAAKPGDRMLNLKHIFDGIYLGDAPSSGSPAVAPPSLKIPGQDGASTTASVKLPPRPPLTPGSDRLLSGGKRASAEKALQRATLSEKSSSSKSGSFHADRGAVGASTPGTPGGSGISLTARNLVLKEKMEKKEKEKSQTKKAAMASRPESVAVAGMDEEELEALAGALILLAR